MLNSYSIFVYYVLFYQKNSQHLRDIKIEMDLQLVEQEFYRGILGKNYLDFR